MSHLTEEQFEDILQGGPGVPEHIGRCADCRARLDEKRALAQRVRGAFASIQAGPDLASRIRADIAAAGGPAAVENRLRIIPLRLHRHIRLGFAAAAAIVIVVVSIAFFVGTGSQTQAAQMALVEIHQANLSSLELPADSHDPDRIGTSVHSDMGHGPTTPCAGCGRNPCNCCVREFCGRPVTSYVVQGSKAPVSVIVVPHSPKALGMTPTKNKAPAGRPVWQSERGGCNMASVRIGEYSYCAVGQVTQEELTGVLNGLSE